MKFMVNSTIFKKGRKLLSSVEERTYPISMSARKEDGSLGSITLTTLEERKFVSISFTGEVEEEGEVMFTSQYLSFFEGDNDEITVVSKDNSFSIRGSCDFTVPIYRGIPPSAPAKQPVGSATFELSDIKLLFKRVLFAVGDDLNPRHDFTCLLLECHSDRIRAVGGDRRLVSLSEIPKGSSYIGSFTLPKGGIYAINKLDGALVTLTFYDGGIMFSSSGELMCDIYMPGAGSKPAIWNYGSFVNVKGNTFLTCEKDLLLRKIEEVRKVSEQMSIALKYDGNGVRKQVRIFAREDNGEAQVNTIFPADWKGDDLKIFVNARTFYDAVEQTTGIVKVSFTNNMGPLLVEGEGDDYRTVMLPYSCVEKR